MNQALSLSALKNAIEHWPQAVVALSSENAIVGISASAADILEINEDFLKEVIGWPVHELLCCRARDHEHASEACPLHQPKSMLGYQDASWVKADGTYIFVSYEIRSVFADGQVARLLLFDRAEERGQSGEDLQRFAQYIELTSAALCELDNEGQILWANSAMNAALFSHGFDQRGVANIFPLNFDGHCQHCWQSQRAVNHIEVQVNDAWFSWHLQPLPQRHKPALLGHIFDITEQKKAQLALAKEKADARRDFFAKMIHELRTPLNAIIGLSQVVLKRSADSLSAEDSKNIQAIRVAGLQLHDMVTDTLDISKIDAGQMVLHKEPVRLYDVFDSFYDQVFTIAEAKALKFSLNCDKNLTLISDATKLRQVLVNLISNAIKYTQAGSVQIKAERKRDKYKGHVAVIRVKDTGIGIPRDQLKSLFKAYAQVTEERNTGIQGTGLGLVLVSEMVKLLDGELAVESEVDKGSTFTLTLPSN